MKYNCDIAKDLMPLCLDHSATTESEKLVIAHLAECKQCADYYQTLNAELDFSSDQEEPNRPYIQLAQKLRKRTLFRRFSIAMFTTLLTITFLIALCFCINYAEGYRFNSQSAADLSGQLNYKAELLGNYEWNGWHFYFYDCYSCYEVVTVEKTSRGWHVTEHCLSWPKWYNFDDLEDKGINLAGTLYFWTYDEGIQLFPMVTNDERIKTIEVTVFGETKTIEAEPDKLLLLTFENNDTTLTNQATATAYDVDGNLLYTLDTFMGHRYWKPIE